MRFAFAGDRDIAVHVLEHILREGHRPSALLLTERGKATHSEALRALLPELASERVFEGQGFGAAESIATLKELDLDYIIGIHFPYVVCKAVLEIPKIGFLNLHPAYLPFNKGWHTPSWAILDRTPYGATLHFMVEALDAGDIIHQKQLRVQPDDTANTLYARAKALELEVFKEAWPQLVSCKPTRISQPTDEGTSHKMKELQSEAVAKILLDQSYRAGDLLDRLRALTTNRRDEAAWFECEGRRYRVRVIIDQESVEP